MTCQTVFIHISCNAHIYVAKYTEKIPELSRTKTQIQKHTMFLRTFRALNFEEIQVFQECVETM